MKLSKEKYEITLHTKYFSVTFSRQRQKSLQLQKDGYWKTKHGELIHVSKMTDKHLINTVGFLKCKALKEAEQRFPANPYHWPEPRGEMAQELYWRNMPEFDLVNMLGKFGVTQRYLQGQPIFQAMLEEAQSRGLTVFPL